MHHSTDVPAITSWLYELERVCVNVDSKVRQAKRMEHAMPLLKMLEKWLGEREFLPKSLIGQAATYSLNQWSTLGRYVEDGELAINNNAADRAMRPVAIGRKNWLFVGNEAVGSRAAVLMSSIGSCKNNFVEPWAYLHDVIGKLAAPGPDLEQLLPDNWLESNPQHRWSIAEEREANRR